MNPEPLKRRTKAFVIRVLVMLKDVPQGEISKVIVNQLARSASSTGANYRAACRPRSLNDFISKISIVSEEADETVYWLEILTEMELLVNAETTDLLREARELSAIFTASAATAKRNRNSGKDS